MNKTIDIIGLDKLYQDQNFYKCFPYRIFNLSDLRGVNYLCTRDTLLEIKLRLKSLKASGIRYLSSGNYHYLTSIFLEKIIGNFSLVLLDNHTELLPAPYDGFISCGSWLNHVLKVNPNLKEVFILGVSKKYILDLPKEIRLSNKLCFISREEILDNQNVIEKINPKYKVYLSIDKDVFTEKLAITNWDHGIMEFKDFKVLISKIGQQIFSVDICGEDNINLSQPNKFTKKDNLKKNNILNYRIVETLFNI